MIEERERNTTMVVSLHETSQNSKFQILKMEGIQTSGIYLRGQLSSIFHEI
jgi:hypothetical protein